MTNKEIITELEKCKEMVEHWGSYASRYFQEKYDLEGNIKEIDEMIMKFQNSNINETKEEKCIQITKRH